MTRPEAERLAVVETKVDAVLEQLEIINNKFENLDKKYASKWVQTAVAAVIGMIVMAVIGALVALVVIKPTADTTVKVTTPIVK